MSALIQNQNEKQGEESEIPKSRVGPRSRATAHWNVQSFQDKGQVGERAGACAPNFLRRY